MSRVPPLTLFAFALGLAGCERGCLSSWLGERVSPGRGTAGEGQPSVELLGTDCSDGLLRCVEGHVERSLAGHIPFPCAPTAERPGARCECRWDEVAVCDAGCAIDGAEVVAGADASPAQLCRSSVPVARLPGAGDAPTAPVCAASGVTCADGRVLACEAGGRPVRVLAVCLLGCDPAIAFADDGVPSAEPGGQDLGSPGGGAPGILCRRAHAERR